MKPPICVICGEKFDPKVGGLIYFKKTKKDKEWDKKAENPRFKGHPPYAGWFCSKHYPKAKEFGNLTLAEAITNIKSQEG